MPFSSDIPFVSSPNFSSRRGMTPVGTCIHYTAGGSASGSIRWLCNPQARASAHFVISRSGRITQLVELNMRAWHAGVAEMKHPITGEMESLPDRFLIGVELANHGMLQKHDGVYYYEIGRQLKRYKRAEPEYGKLVYDNGTVVEGYWECYPNEQLDALQDLLRKLADKGFKDAATNLIGHEEIAMPFGRKKDPGFCLPWNRFHRKAPRRTSQVVGHPPI